MSTPPARPRIRWTSIVLLETTNLLSGVSNGVVTVAIPWLVLQRTGSVMAAGIVAAVSALPGIIASPLAGWAVDHFGRRVVSIFSDLLSAISVAAIPIVAIATDLTLPWILALAMLGATFDPAGYTARKALIPDVADASGMNLDRLNGWHEGIFGVGWILGPLAGTILIATLGDTAAFWVPCVLFLVAAALITALRVDDAGQIAKAERKEAGIIGPSAWQNAILGAKIVWHDPVLRALTIAVMVLATVYLPTETVLLPVHFIELEQPTGLGMVLASFAAGGVIGSFAYGWLSSRMRQITIIRWALIGTAALYIPIAFLPPLPLFVAVGFVFGLAWGPMQPLLTSVVQRRVDPDAQGRVFGIQTSLFYAAPPAGMLLAGVLAERFGIKAVLLGIAVLLVLTAAGVIASRKVRQIDTPVS